MTTTLNGRLYDFVTIKVAIPKIGRTAVTLQSLTYGHEMPKELHHGSGVRPVGYTRGGYMPKDAELEMLMGEADDFRALLGPDYMNVEFSLTISYVDVGAGLTARTDELKKCHITAEDPNVTQGTDPAKCKWTLKPIEVVMNGTPATVAVAA